MSILTKSKCRNAKTLQDMDKNVDLEQTPRAIKNVVDNRSWFRDNPHYWAQASLPMAYVAACVEVVSKMSDKAGYSLN